jgi:tetratricopeptide (TPR) repeat protein
MSNIEELERDAESFEQAGQLEASLECWRQLASVERSRYHLVNRGRVALKLGLLDEAEGALQAAVEVTPTHAEAYFRLGLLYLRKPDLPAAVRSYRQGLALEENPAARLLLATAEDDLGLSAEARDNFERVIAVEPDNDEAWFGLGLSLRFDDHERAISCFRKAIELDPQRSAAHRELGFRLWRKGLLEEAEQSLRTAVELDPSDAWAHSYLGRVYDSRQSFDDAEREFLRAADAWPERSFFHCELGELYEKTGRVAEAESAFLTALSRESHDPHGNLKFGDFLRRQGKLEKAVAYLRRAAAADPRDERPGKILQAMGQKTE